MLYLDKQEKMELIRCLQRFRLEKKISLEKLAKTLGVAYSTISKWERGKMAPNKIKAYHIEKFLKKHRAL